MSDYRLYFLNPAGRFCGVDEFTAPDDATALARAQAADQTRPRELWSRAELIRKFEGSRQDQDC